MHELNPPFICIPLSSESASAAVEILELPDERSDNAVELSLRLSVPLTNVHGSPLWEVCLTKFTEVELNESSLCAFESSVPDELYW